jgi:hypothetical protein
MLAVVTAAMVALQPTLADANPGAPAPPAPRCDTENARYVVRDRKDITAGFARRKAQAAEGAHPPELMFYVTMGAVRQTYWFEFSYSNGQEIQVHLMSVPAPGRASTMLGALGGPDHPLGDRLLDYLAVDQSYRFIGLAPRPGALAPQHILVPQLRAAFWYETQPKQAMPLAFFDLARCDAAGPQRTAP